MYRLISCISILLLFQITLIYSQNAKLSGKVKTQSNKPAIGLTLVVLEDFTFQTSTDSTGSFLLNVPAEKKISIKLTGLGFVDTIVRLYFKENEIKKIDFEITDKKELIAVNVENWGNTGFDMDPARVTFIPGATDISTLLKGMLGTSSSNELSTGYNVRGGNYDENLVYVNDIEVYRPFLARSGASEGLSFANVEMVKNLTFSPGGFEAKYGDRMSSVLDIFYKKPKSFSASSFVSMMGANANAEGRSANGLLGWMVGARYKTNQYLLRTLDVQGDYRPKFYDIQAFLNFDFTESFQLEYLSSVAVNDYQVIPSSRETRFGTINEAYSFKVYFDGKEQSKFQTIFNAISATFKPLKGSKKDSLKLKLIASNYNTREEEHFTVMGQYYIDQLETDFGDPDFGNVAFNRGIGTLINHGRNDLTANVSNLEHKGKWMTGRNQLLWGIRFQNELINDRISEWKYLDSAGYSLPQGNMTIIELQDVVKNKISLSSNRIMGYAEYILNKKLKDTSDLSLTGGIRSNYWTFNNQNVISPRVTLAWRPNWKKLGNNMLVFKASAGYYYQPPFYREFRDFEGKINNDIRAQQSIHYTLTADYNLKIWNRNFKMVGALYYKQLNNLIPYEIDNVRIRYYAKNNAVGYATGFDFRMNGEFVKDIESWISLSVMQTRENLLNDFYYRYYDSLGNPWYKGYSVIPVADSIKYTPGYIPRPTDQRVSVSVFFQDYLKNIKTCRVHMLNTFGSSLPFGPPTRDRVSDTLRMPGFWRIDCGFSYMIRKELSKDELYNLNQPRKFQWLKSAWLSLEILNLTARQNVISYIWVRDVTNRTYAIPNFLTNRQINLKLQLKF
ncbi:MAG: TonB-dependent receptor plug domain-containing protein [Bacteroidota bacterium]